MSAAAAIVAITEEAFKDYLLVCEYLQISPTDTHDIEFIRARAEQLLLANKDLDEKSNKRLQKKVNWFIKNYSNLTGNSWKDLNFVKRCNNLIQKNALTIHPETVNEQFQPAELTQKNYDSYYSVQKKQVRIALIAIAAIALIGTAIFLLIHFL